MQSILRIQIGQYEALIIRTIFINRKETNKHVMENKFYVQFFNTNYNYLKTKYIGHDLKAGLIFY